MLMMVQLSSAVPSAVTDWSREPGEAEHDFDLMRACTDLTIIVIGFDRAYCLVHSNWKSALKNATLLPLSAIGPLITIRGVI
jgi:hypothetical protein